MTNFVVTLAIDVDCYHHNEQNISDLELLELAREEFHRRLKAYQAWKQKNSQRKKKQAAKPDLPLSAASPASSYKSNVLSRNELSRDVGRWVWEKIKGYR